MAGTAAGAAKRAAAKVGAATPQDRKAPTRKAVARKRAVSAEPLEPAARAEVATEGVEHDDDLPDDGSVRVEFDGNVFDVQSPGEWRNSAQEALGQGMFGIWARGALYPDSVALWLRLDFRNRECVAFMEAFDVAFRARYGDDPKELQTRFASPGSTRRR